MKTMTLSDFFQSEYFQYWDNDNRSCGGFGMILSDTERFDRCYDAAKNGADGSTHSEIIQDWTDCLKTVDTFTEDEESDLENGYLKQDDYDAIEIEINECYDWHEKNNSLNEQLG